ncbi:bolA-like protein 3 [Stomoxys calcitrans]|uniref:BolA-like protein 3 n=1 Tax=Stomoxys calcitrans TaxID=35570 RepID=A0A1I8P1L7_STOCA|nr:bolA-like protein 3 [Stomoxys calcitrans]
MSGLGRLSIAKFLNSFAGKPVTVKAKCLDWLVKREFSSNNSEKIIQQTLATRFPKATTIEVRDVSGGCGAMFEVFVETDEFVGLNTLKQHKLVTNTLKDQIKEMHGVRIHTAIPASK